jgi:WD40 repeat protein
MFDKCYRLLLCGASLQVLATQSPHRGAVQCMCHMPSGSYSSLDRPLLASGGLDHTVKVWDPWSQDAASSKETCLQVRVVYRDILAVHGTVYIILLICACKL